MKNTWQFIDRTNEEGFNNFGSKIIIKSYRSAKSIDIFFPEYNYTVTNREYKEFKKGIIKCPYEKRLCEIGYIGEGKYKSKGKDGKKTKAYNEWCHIIRRCYDPYCINDDRRLSYVDCFVCEEWHCFQNFAEWFYKNYYEVIGQKMHLDKDILVKGNKIYSPKNCIFVPERINTLFIKATKSRGKYPIGVYEFLDKRNGNRKLRAQCSILKDEKVKRKYLGDFPIDRPFQAFTTYKNFKENYIKQVADEYKGLIPQKLYEAMYNYEVEIND